MALTATEVKQAKPKDKSYKLADGAGLFLLVNPKGAKYWRYKYRYAGVVRLTAFVKKVVAMSVMFVSNVLAFVRSPYVQNAVLAHVVVKSQPVMTAAISLALVRRKLKLNCPTVKSEPFCIYPA